MNLRIEELCRVFKFLNILTLRIFRGCRWGVFPAPMCLCEGFFDLMQWSTLYGIHIIQCHVSSRTSEIIKKNETQIFENTHIHWNLCNMNRMEPDSRQYHYENTNNENHNANDDPKTIWNIIQNAFNIPKFVKCFQHCLAQFRESGIGLYVGRRPCQLVAEGD